MPFCLTIAVFMAVLYVFMHDFATEQLAIDRCLDNGGRWDDREKTCQTSVANGAMMR